MANTRDTGTLIHWNDDSRKGLIHASTNTYVSCNAINITYTRISKGDIVSFITVKDSQTGDLNAFDVQKNYSHNIAPKRGIVYFQKVYYTASQMSHIASTFENDLDRAPRVLFSDNYRDFQRKSHEMRITMSPQAKVVAPYDRSFGFAIPTTFQNAKALGFVNNDHNFKTIIRHLFTKLDKHLKTGGDVIIPAPLDAELTNNRNTYFRNKKQVIFHNIGTAGLKSHQKVLFIQQMIDELKSVASDCKVVHCEVTYAHRVEQMPTDMSRNTNNKKGCLVFQTSWYDSEQLQCIDSEYKSEYKSAPRFLFGDNNKDNERKSWQSRQMFGGQAAVVGKHDRTIGYGIVTTFFGATTPSIYRYKPKMDQQFKRLADHLQSGYDVIVPYPTSKDINSNRHRYYDTRTGKQVIFHNLGTGIASLSMEHIKYIQSKIDELKKFARRVEHAEYYNYDPKTKQLLTRKQSVYNDPPSQHSQATSAAHEKMIDQREWQCNLCHVICQGYQDTCNKCHAPKGAKKQVHSDVAAVPYAPNQKQSAPHTDELRKLNDDINELQAKNMSLEQKLNDQMSDLQTANVQLQQQKEIQENEKDKMTEHNTEVLKLKEHVLQLQTQLKLKEDESIKMETLKKERDDALKLKEHMLQLQTQLKLKEDEAIKMKRFKKERDDALKQVTLQNNKSLQYNQSIDALRKINTEYMDKIKELRENNIKLIKTMKLQGSGQWKSKDDESIKMNKLQKERDDALKQVVLRDSKLSEYIQAVDQLRQKNVEYMQKLDELRQRNTELQSRVFEMERRKLQEEVKKLREKDDINKSMDKNINDDIVDTSESIQNIKVGDRVELQKGWIGCVKHIGPEYIGLALDEPLVDGHDGQGVFVCEPLHGYFTQRCRIKRVIRTSSPKNAQPVMDAHDNDDEKGWDKCKVEKFIGKPNDNDDDDVVKEVYTLQ